MDPTRKIERSVGLSKSLLLLLLCKRNELERWAKLIYIMHNFCCIKHVDMVMQCDRLQQNRLFSRQTECTMNNSQCKSSSAHRTWAHTHTHTQISMGNCVFGRSFSLLAIIYIWTRHTLTATQCNAMRLVIRLAKLFLILQLQNSNHQLLICLKLACKVCIELQCDPFKTSGFSGSTRSGRRH